MTVKLPCSVVRDLLPLYAENMTETETRTLVDEHLAECPECESPNTNRGGSPSPSIFHK